jgi:glutamate/tyrosine decarboxylase-like PLP-dependent enzyme
VVVDPHKHGLQPYGCGAVLFADPAVGRFYQHDSPYTYFTSTELHLGEISLECSRAGAPAAALWLTLQVLPLTRDGLGEVLAAGRRAALRWAELIAESQLLELYQQPELDIVTYFPAADQLSTVDALAAGMLGDGMRDPDDPVFLSTLRVTGESFVARGLRVRPDVPRGRILRSVLMKPEHETYLPRLHARVERLAGSAHARKVGLA